MADPTPLAPMTTEAFKDCDIRGTYPEQVNEDIFARVGREFGRLVAAETVDGQSGPSIVISGDGRNSTHTLMEATIRGLSAAPIDIVDLGYPLPTPAVYWAKDHLGAQASAIVTASHNPANWDGLKVMNGEMPPRPDDIGLLADRASASAEGRAGAEVQMIDGVRLVWPNGWLLVRRSTIEPKVTIRLDGESEAACG